MIVRYGTYTDVRDLGKLARRIANFGEQRRRQLDATELALEDELQEVVDDAMELYYKLTEMLDNLETED